MCCGPSLVERREWPIESVAVNAEHSIIRIFVNLSRTRVGLKFSPVLQESVMTVYLILLSNS